MSADVPHSTLVERASRGDPVAVDELLVRHLPVLHAWMRLHAGPLLAGARAAGVAVRGRRSMSQLRRKLERDPARPRCPMTEPGVGYVLTPTGRRRWRRGRGLARDTAAG